MKELFIVKKSSGLTLFVLAMSFVANPVSGKSFSVALNEVESVLQDSVYNGKKVPVYDFSRSEIVDGDVPWRVAGNDSAFAEIFLGQRRSYVRRGDDVFLVSEEGRDKSITFSELLNVTNFDGSRTNFTAEGLYCRRENISEAGQFTANRCQAVLIPAMGDTITDAVMTTYTRNYRGALGPDAHDALATDTLARYSYSISYFNVGSDPRPCAVITSQTVVSPSGETVSERTRFFTDPMHTSAKQEDSTPDCNPEFENGTLDVTFADGMIMVTTTGLPDDCLMAVMDRAGNIYSSRKISGNTTEKVSVPGLPFGQYIVSVSSPTAGVTLKQVVFIK